MPPTAASTLESTGLTPREAQVAILAAAGLQTKQLANRLGISFHTARHHMERAYAKLGVRSRAALVITIVGCEAGLSSGSLARQEGL